MASSGDESSAVGTEEATSTDVSTVNKKAATPSEDNEENEADIMARGRSDADNDEGVIRTENENNVPVINNPVITAINATDVLANLDIDDDDEMLNVDCDECDDDYSVPGIQQKWVKAIQKRVQKEVSKDFKSIDTWLIQHLKNNNWWIRKHHAPMITKKLGIQKEYQAYYRDVFVWIPDVRWYDPQGTMMPSCPYCL